MAQLWNHPARPWVAPMALFFAFLALGDFLGLGRWEFPFRVVILAAFTWWCSRDVIDLRISSAGGSIAIGLAIFAVWIAPDALWPGYRDHWLFQNSVLGKINSSVPPGLTTDYMALAFRAIRAVILVPVIEELFWRGWLMRWLINPDFKQVPLGAYAAQAFWITAGLFAVEHGPYWEVGLLAGIAFNWWMIRTKSLGDCILAHAVANAALSAYVVFAQKWEYWL